ncbi:MAG: PIN domain-containing protein [candidate division NC10 bacterium]|nr:PIN domain-containing protein [candidate division NC10 bacterium]
MKGGVLVDTGPLVASINRRDRFHTWTKVQLAEMEPPIFTCEAVLAEACFLLRNLPGGSSAVMEFLARRILEVPFRLEEHAGAVASLLQKYMDAPMSLADACLVRMSELREDSLVWTLDKHFRLYRRHARQVIPTLMPPGS